MLTLKSSILLFFIGVTLLVTPTGCQTSAKSETIEPVRTLVNSTLIGEYTTAQLKSRFTGAYAALQIFVRYGVKAYRLEYTTTNNDGKPIKASGAIIVPNITTPAAMISMQHGTIQSDNDAPSNFLSGSEAYSYGSVFASQGYIIVAPDYIGYGASKDIPHTYIQQKGLATASLDMLRAARNFLDDKNLNWDKRLYITGYSEGGYATLALQKKIEEETGSEFNLVASSCGAGPYDQTAFVSQILNQPTTNVAYINQLYIWVLLTYDRMYGLNRPMSAYFKEPYASQVASSGKDARISVSLNQAFTDAFKKGINDGTDKEFLAAIKDNDIHDWKPRTPTQLYHGDADEIVAYMNSKNTYDAMIKRGATRVELKTMKGATHATGILEYVTGTYAFFGAVQ
ncbi:alpha/beta fold hydrolase [Spirosoma daeguense]